MKISKKLTVGFLIVALLAAAVGAVGIFSIISIRDAGADLYEKDTLGLQYAGDAGVTFQQLRYNSLKLANTDVTDQAGMQETVSSINDCFDQMDDLLAECDSTITNEEIRTLLSEIQSQWASYKPAMQADNQNRLNGVASAVDGDLVTLGSGLRDNFLQLFSLLSARAETRSEENAASARQAIIVMGAVIAAALVLALILGTSISGSIGKPLAVVTRIAEMLAVGDLNTEAVLTEKDLQIKFRKDEIGQLFLAFNHLIAGTKEQARAAKQVADGDLTTEVTVRSENDLLGRELSSMVTSFHTLASSIISAADQVASGAGMVSDSSMALSQGATEQASSVEELTASVEEISSQTSLNAENAEKANELSQNAKVNADSRNTQMRDMLKAMDEINESSNSINKIIKVIDDIAFQTNILALNAAVEAARAGQHGKGFAVVAEEVRTLAARSASAAKETTDLIEGSIRKVEAGTKIANETAKALERIVDDVEKAANLVGAIATASKEQAIGIEQINQGILQVSQVVQTNAATSEESAAASEELSSQAAHLKEIVGTFRIRKAEGASPAAAPAAQKKPAAPAGRPSGDARPDEAAVGAGTGRAKIVLSDSEFGKY
ncbi:MAG TPA: methyl-accepting chemotaxis protein [Oscillospiraceae bacterium]|nr:methyl-accepting chemotaxis protein [Oscillospiraceae bacterium]